ncbi:MAG: OmpA family protein [Cypionkella sp.]|uniref:OmpA family protein n=1 Tax=Cypionkella sp. TaxID=2811411 RepID=UPI002ABCA9E3|nr:OmpA family protein [Cypionkella sp.]MDZ4312759.1 OmpA family protein [Cypionkella sp.]
MQLRSLPLIAAALLGLAACDPTEFNREAGASVDEGGFGNSTMNNTLVMSGERDYTYALAERFAKTVPSTITFAFNSSELTPEARAALAQQADFIRQFPQVRFRVYGHTDLVGSNAYNKALGLRRARAAVAYLASLGIGGSRLEAVASFGKTRPIIQTSAPEQRNRRTVTEVSGFVKNDPMVLNGKYAQIIFQEYVKGAVVEHGSYPVPAQQPE